MKNDTFIYIPGSLALMAVQHIRRRRQEVAASYVAKMEELKTHFFEKKVNTKWARFNSPGVWRFWVKLSREESDALFMDLYTRKAGVKWPMWAMSHLDTFGEHEYYKKARDEYLAEAETVFASGLGMYVSQEKYTGILRLDKAFSGLQNLINPAPFDFNTFAAPDFGQLLPTTS